MGNGKDLIEMVCQSYETPEEGEPKAQPNKGHQAAGAVGEDDSEEEEDEEEAFDFSEWPDTYAHLPWHVVIGSTVPGCLETSKHKTSVNQHRKEPCLLL